MKPRILQRMAALAAAREAALLEALQRAAQVLAEAARQTDILAAYRARLAASWQGGAVLPAAQARRAGQFTNAAAAAAAQLAQDSARAEASHESLTNDLASLVVRRRRLDTAWRDARRDADGEAEFRAARDQPIRPRAESSFCQPGLFRKETKMDLSFYTNFSNSVALQEAQINTLQQQISTGLTVQTPDQNPAAYETATLGQDQITSFTNDSNTQAAIQVQLGSVNDAYQSTSNLLNNVQAVLEQALNGTSSPQNLNALGAQVSSIYQQLVAIGNTTAPNGTYLFGGSRGTAAPFQENGSGNIVYLGDGGQSQAAISNNSSASTIANGEVFTGSLAGDGVGSISAAIGNIGSGQLLNEGVVNANAAAAFQSGSAPITLSFANGSGQTTYKATQNGGVIGSGTLNGTTTVQLAGVDYQITGAPAAGDSFTIAPSRPQSLFALLKTIQSTLSTAGTTPAQVAQTNQVLNQGLASIGQYQQAVVTAQAQNGVTLQAITNAGTGNTNQSTQVQTHVQNATAVNTPVAIAALDQTLSALQAAMKTFGDVQNLSLFNYI